MEIQVTNTWTPLNTLLSVNFGVFVRSPEDVEITFEPTPLPETKGKVYKFMDTFNVDIIKQSFIRSKGKSTTIIIDENFYLKEESEYYSINCSFEYIVKSPFANLRIMYNNKYISPNDFPEGTRFIGDILISTPIDVNVSNPSRLGLILYDDGVSSSSVYLFREGAYNDTTTFLYTYVTNSELYNQKRLEIYKKSGIYYISNHYLPISEYAKGIVSKEDIRPLTSEITGGLYGGLFGLGLTSITTGRTYIYVDSVTGQGTTYRALTTKTNPSGFTVPNMTDFVNISTGYLSDRIKSYKSGNFSMLQIDNTLQISYSADTPVVQIGNFGTLGYAYSYTITLPVPIKNIAGFSGINKNITGIEYQNSMDLLTPTQLNGSFVSAQSVLASATISVLLIGEVV